jgi:hypothetical protein
VSNGYCKTPGPTVACLMVASVSVGWPCWPARRPKANGFGTGSSEQQSVCSGLLGGSPIGVPNAAVRPVHHGQSGSSASSDG